MFSSLLGTGAHGVSCHVLPFKGFSPSSCHYLKIVWPEVLIVIWCTYTQELPVCTFVGNDLLVAAKG
jgi:hypothetical protein